MPPLLRLLRPPMARGNHQPDDVEAKIDELLMRFGNFWCLVGMCFVLVKSMVSRRLLKT